MLLFDFDVTKTMNITEIKQMVQSHYTKVYIYTYIEILKLIICVILFKFYFVNNGVYE